jgi:ATP-dependent helicase/nuclease subunit A
MKKPERPAAPSWLREPVGAVAARPAPLAPSLAFDEEFAWTGAPGATAADRQHALARGLIVHRLLQSLPDIPPALRTESAQRFLNGPAADGFSAEERSAMLRQVLTILDGVEFAGVFASGSRAEVPIVGRIPGDGGAPLEVAGQVDRLAISDDTVLIADYKTDATVPLRLDDVPPKYLVQLALYRAIITRLYPDKTVRAALIFTQGPVLLEMPAASMDRAVEAELRRDRHAPVKVP